MATLSYVPSQGTPKRTVRADDALWKAFTEASKAKGLSGAENIRRFMRREVDEYRASTGQPPLTEPGQADDAPDTTA